MNHTRDASGNPSWQEVDSKHGLKVSELGYTLNAPVSVAITTSSTLVVAANPLRRFLSIQCNGAADVTFVTGAGPATLAGGMPLMANAMGATYPGGYWESAHNGAVYAIGRAASNVIVLEGF